MKYLIPAIVAVVSLCAAEVRACEPVALLAPQAVYAAPVAVQAVYQPQVLALEVQPVHYALPLQVRVRNHHCGKQLNAGCSQNLKAGQPVRNFVRRLVR